MRHPSEHVHDNSIISHLNTFITLLVVSLIQWLAWDAERILAPRFPGSVPELTALQFITGTDPADPLSGPVRRDQATRLLAFAQEGPDPQGALFSVQSDHQALIERLDRELTQILWSALHLLEVLGPARTHRVNLLRSNQAAANSGLRNGPDWLDRELEDAFDTDAPPPRDVHPPPTWVPMTNSPEAWKTWKAWVESDPLREPSFTLLDFIPQTTVAALILDQREHPERDPLRRASRKAHARALLNSALQFDQVWVELQERLVKEALTRGRSHLLRQPARRAGGVQSDDMPIEQFFQHVRTYRRESGQSPPP